MTHLKFLLQHKASEFKGHISLKFKVKSRESLFQRQDCPKKKKIPYFKTKNVKQREENPQILVNGPHLWNINVKNQSDVHFDITTS